MKYTQRFLTFKGYSATSMFLGQPGICQFTSPNIRIIPDRFLCCLPRGNTISRSHPGKFLKIFHFPRWVKQSPPMYWGRVKMLPLTKKELKLHQDATKCYICGKRFLKKFANDKNCRKVTDNCHFTGRYRGTAHSMCI